MSKTTRHGRTRRWFRHPALLLAINISVLGSACKREPSSGSSTDGAEAAGPTQPRAPATSRGDELDSPPSAAPPTVDENIQRVFPYPRGRWRLAPAGDLDRVVVWFSHILIRYAGVLDENVSFSPLPWSAAERPSSLDRETALALAQRIAGEAATGVSFAQLAAAYSEDSTTADRGGSLGGVTGTTIAIWSQIADGLAVLRPGETSQVIESPFGFHILKRQATPPEQIVSGSHIVIGYDEAPFFRGSFMRADAPRRSHAEAAALAREVYALAQREPGSFPDLVALYSEHLDASSGGDWGQWSTREALAPSRQLERLAQLEVGEVAPPIDTPFGFQILLRTANRERPEFAHQAVEVMFDPRVQESDPDSEAWARERASDVGARLDEDPGLFDRLRAELCCTPTRVWREGRQDPGLQAALSALRIGEIGKTPVRTAGSFAFVRRMDPGAQHPAPVSFELPEDPTPDISAFLTWALDMELTNRIVRALGDAGTELHLDHTRSQTLRGLHTIPSGVGTGEERAQRISAIDAGVKALLSPSEYQGYHNLAGQLVERAVLDPQETGADAGR